MTAPAALAFYTSDPSSGAAGYPSHAAYTCYVGPATNFPPPSKWQSFTTLWNFQVTNALQPIGDSAAEIAALHDAIVAVAQTARIDARVILAVVLVESTGNVRVGCTDNGVRNCGLMQSHDPLVGAYDPANMQASITQMIRDGSQGTSHGAGLVQLLNADPDVWRALRAYNSGSVNGADLSDGKGATAPYVSDVANYLQGWQGYGDNVRTSCAW